MWDDMAEMRGKSAPILLYLGLGALVIALAVLVAGRTPSRVHGGAGIAGVTTTKPVPPRVSVPATLLADGTVPWVDEPAGESEFALPPPARRPVDQGAKPCTATQLSATLPRWTVHIIRDDAGNEIGNAGLLGFVEVRNTSDRGCTLQGETPAALLVDGRRLDLLYSHAINKEGRMRVTMVPLGEMAALRLDWSTPYCAGPRSGRQVIDLDLPSGGGHLLAPVRDSVWPICTRSELHPEYTSTLSTSGWDEPAKPSPPFDSPLNPVTARLQPGRAAGPGHTITYHVVLSNPTGHPIPLDDCPGYIQERFSRGDATHEAVNDHQLYRLNCRPVHAIPAHGSVRFAMVVEVPSTLEPGRRFDVTWRLLARGLDPNKSHTYGVFSIAVAPR